MIRAATFLMLVLSSVVPAMGGVEATEPDLRMEVSPREATVGDRLEATLSVLLPRDVRLETNEIGPQLGPLAVVDGSWRDPLAEGQAQRWTWNGTLEVFRTGEMELPTIRVEFRRPDGSVGSVESNPVRITVLSVLDPEEIAEDAHPQLADLKPPAGLEPDYSGLWAASALLALLLAIAAAAWWLKRRFAANQARGELDDDPLLSIPPHVWVREALQALLDRRLVEQGQVDLFFMELAKIVKLYLGGRYQVDLLERTSSEVPRGLAQAGTPAAAIEETSGLLGMADRVKFAGERPGAERCRRAVATAYGIVDATRPRKELQPEDERGAA